MSDLTDWTPDDAAHYADYPSLRFERPAAGVLAIVLDGPNLNAVSPRMHRDLAEVWTAIERDARTRAVLVRGEGKAFSSGGQFELLQEMANDRNVRTRVMHEARAMVLGVLDLSKPVVSAIHGPAVGAGLAIGMMADVSIVGKKANIVDGHTRLGVAAGDHAVLCWPLLCGMAKAKYYLLTCYRLTGEEAERIGLVSVAVDDELVYETALNVATDLALGAAEALRGTKQSLNHWYRAQIPAFEASLAHEFYDFGTASAQEGISAIQEKRKPDFVSVEAANQPAPLP